MGTVVVFGDVAAVPIGVLGGILRLGSLTCRNRFIQQYLGHLGKGSRFPLGYFCHLLFFLGFEIDRDSGGILSLCHKHLLSIYC